VTADNHPKSSSIPVTKETKASKRPNPTMQSERTSKAGKASPDLSGDQKEKTVIPIAMVMQAETSSQKARLFSIEGFLGTESITTANERQRS
jgi:hypothetical protein